MEEIKVFFMDVFILVLNECCKDYGRVFGFQKVNKYLDCRFFCNLIVLDCGVDVVGSLGYVGSNREVSFGDVDNFLIKVVLSVIFLE